MGQIKYNTYLTEKLTAKGSDQKQRDKADAMIHDMQASLEKLASDIQTVDSSYTSSKARDYLSIRGSKVGFTEKIGLVRSFLGTVFIALIIFICVSLRLSLSGKEEKAV